MPISEFSYTEMGNSGELDFVYRDLLIYARQISENAYAPYSNFKVGCAVLMENGKIVSGVNVENASYSVGICAERSALASAQAQYPDEKITAIAISCRLDTGTNSKPVFPCGMCRQFLSESEMKNKQPIPLILSGLHGSVVLINSVNDLLPFSFNRKDFE